MSDRLTEYRDKRLAIRTEDDGEPVSGRTVEEVAVEESG